MIDDVDRAAWHNSQHKWSDVSSSLAAPRGMSRPKAPAAQVDRREAVCHGRVLSYGVHHFDMAADKPINFAEHVQLQELGIAAESI